MKRKIYKFLLIKSMWLRDYFDNLAMYFHDKWWEAQYGK